MDKPEEATGLLDILDLSLAQLMATDESVLASCIRQVLAEQKGDEGAGIVTAFQSAVRS